MAYFSAFGCQRGIPEKDSLVLVLVSGTFVYLLHILGFYDVSDIDQVLVAGILAFPNNAQNGDGKIRKLY